MRVTLRPSHCLLATAVLALTLMSTALPSTASASALSPATTVSSPGAIALTGAAAFAHGASYPASSRYGGRDGSVDTRAKVSALVRAQHTAAQVQSTLGQLSARDRRYVLAGAYTPASVTYTTERRSEPVPVTSPVRAAAAAAFTRTLNVTATIRSAWGWQIYNFHSDWQWTGSAGRVTTATHQEFSTYQMLGWSYSGSQSLQPYGCLGCTMVGREMLGTFTFGKLLVAKNYLRMQVQVNGAPGFWFWWAASGYGTS